MLKQRIITAIILIPIFLFLLFTLTPPWFLFLMSLVTVGAAWEWTNLMQLQTLVARLIYVFLMVFMLMGAIFVPVPLMLMVAVIGWVIAIPFIFLYPRLNYCWNKGVIIRGLLGFFVLIPCWAALNFIRNQRDGIWALLFLFVLIWSADSAAYFVGRKWGRIKLAPAVSPGKTWEGFAGAIVFSAILVLAVLWMTQAPQSTWVPGVVLSLITVMFSVLGDLFESMLKREASLKDSGKLLPGHGGLLDRIDSLTAAAPLFALGGWVLGQLLN
jgi:phosphatidate cytidylyltransferase